MYMRYLQLRNEEMYMRVFLAKNEACIIVRVFIKL